MIAWHFQGPRLQVQIMYNNNIVKRFERFSESGGE